ncbi:MAG: DNA polymerase III subunit delta [Pseudomonadota bacterium]
MSLAPQQLATVLKDRLAGGNPPTVVLINGNELLLIEETLDEVRKVLQGSGFEERLSYVLDAHFDWSDIAGGNQTMSLFAQRRALELRVPKSLGAAGTKTVAEIAANESEDILLIIMPLLDRRQRQAKWFKTVEQHGLVVDIFDIPSHQLGKWIKQRLQSKALRVEQGVVEQLAALNEGNLLAAAQEIEKLKVLAPDGAVTLALLHECLADQARFDVYTLVDVCLSGQLSRAERIIERLKSEGVEPVIVSWVLVRDIRTLVNITRGLASGESQANLYKQHQVWSKRQALFDSVCARFSYSNALSLLESAANLDRMIKGQAKPEQVHHVWFQIWQLCANLCQGQQIAA